MLQKESAPFNFVQGMDTLSDPNQLPLGKFTIIQNSAFVQSGGLESLNKRNGYVNLAALDSQSSYIASYSGGLVSVSGTQFKQYSSVLNTWSSISPITPLQLSVSPLVRNAFNQIGFDLCVSGGLACVAYLENATYGSGSSVIRQQYAVIDTITGQNVAGPAQITSVAGTVSQTSISRVFSIGSTFAVFSGIPNANVSSGNFGALQYFTINQNNLSVSAPTIFSRSYMNRTTGSASINNGFDGVVASNSLYFSWYAGSASGRSGLLTTNFSTNMTQGTTSALTQSNGYIAGLSVCADNAGPSPSRIWNTYTATGSSGQSLRRMRVGIAVSDFNLNFVSSVNVTSDSNSTLGGPGGPAFNWDQVTSYAVNGTMTFLLQAISVFTGPSYREDFVYKISTGLNFIEYDTNIQKSIIYNMGIGSKPSVIGSDSYWLAAFNSTYQSTYFLVNSANSFISKLSYGNGGGFYYTDVPQMQSIGSSLFVGYLNKESISNVNKNTNVSSQTQTAGIYAQTGINYAKFNFTTIGINSIETANNLHFGGGQVYHFDGQALDETNFNVYPDFIYIPQIIGLTGSMSQQSYFYVATYEYTDNKGNIVRSSPSIPVNVTVSSGFSAIQVTAPTYLCTLKNLSNPRVVIYRWSNNQQTYYQVTSQVSPYTAYDQYGVLQSYISFIDTHADAEILGNNILYTNGGVVEDVSPPATTAMTMFDSRAWYISAEDGNLLGYSKTIIEGTPVEFSDLFTYFVPPNSATGAPSGPVKSFAPMDDKLILFKNQTIFYINGTGPDSTGANNQYSPTPIFVVAGVGCTNQSSIVLTPQGLMFQNGTNGIWLLKRDLSIEFVGKDVISYATRNVLSAVLIPNTTQVKFTMSGGVSLMYDYLVNQWGVDTNNGQSACIYGGLHTYLTNTGSIFQESPGSYLDGTVPVVMSFTTGWVNPGILQGYQRAYWLDLLGQYQSGHTYTVGIAYDYNGAIAQTATINPTNTLGSGSSVEQWQINFARQQCQSFQLTFTEISSGTAGAGLTLSGGNLVYGRKKTYPRNIPPGNRTS